jgi:hypothetical protein
MSGQPSSLLVQSADRDAVKLISDVDAATEVAGDAASGGIGAASRLIPFLLDEEE